MAEGLTAQMNKIWQVFNGSSTAWKWFYRSLKRGDWLWLCIAIVIASSSVTTISYLGASIKQSMQGKAANNLGADIILRSSRPIDKQWLASAQQLGLKTNQSISLITMAQNSDETFQMVNLKGVESAQPLRGELTANKQIPFQTLNENQIWIDPKLIAILDLQLNSELLLGTQHFSVAGSLETTGLLNPMTQLAPQATILLSDLAKTQLLGPGSRVTYEVALAGSNNAIQAFSEQFQAAKPKFIQLISAQAPSEDFEKTLDRAWLFLDLAALSAVFVAGLSILIASRFYLQRWQQSVALLRANGGSDAQLRRLFSWQFIWIGTSSSFVGVILAILLVQLLKPWLGTLFDPFIGSAWTEHLLLGFISGNLVLWSFSLQSFQTVITSSPVQVFKRVNRSKTMQYWFLSLLLILILVGLIVKFDYLPWILLLGIGLSFVFYVLAWLLLFIIRKLHPKTRGSLRIALAMLLKEPGQLKIQLISIGLVLFVLLLMSFVRQDLLNSWRDSLPAKTPNTFVMNVQPYQLETTQALLQKQKLNPDFVAMARARLVSINNQAINPQILNSDRAQRLLQREANIAVSEQIPAYNQITAQLTKSEFSGLGVSVEAGIAKLFNIQLGDTLSFNFAGQTLSYQVRSLREVNWQSFRLNFFFIIEPKPTQALNISYISSLYIENKAIRTDLNQQFAKDVSGVLLIDVGQIIEQIRQIMNQAASGVSALFIFTLIASLAVLFSATQATPEARIQSWLLLRTLGANNRQIRLIGLSEFVLLGLLASLIAATLAQIVSLVLSTQLLELKPQLSWTLWFTGFALGGGTLLLLGWLTQYPYLRMSANQLKRQIPTL